MVLINETLYDFMWTH